MKKRKQTKILSSSILIHILMCKDIFPSIHPTIRMFSLYSTAFEKTGTVGKFKTSVLIPLFCWINIHTCHGSKSFSEVWK